MTFIEQLTTAFACALFSTATAALGRAIFTALTETPSATDLWTVFWAAFTGAWFACILISDHQSGGVPDRSG